jgi:flagella basal body P-ring formation protein FlgA
MHGAGAASAAERWAPAATEPAGQCLALVNPVAAGAHLSAADAAPAPCMPTSPAAAVAYERQSGSVRAETDLDAGTPLGRIRLPASRGVAAGERLILTSTVGPVRIRREVTALQPGRGGGRLFVRTGDGEILAAPVAEAPE